MTEERFKGFLLLIEKLIYARAGARTDLEAFFPGAPPVRAGFLSQKATEATVTRLCDALMRGAELIAGDTEDAQMLMVGLDIPALACDAVALQEVVQQVVQGGVAIVPELERLLAEAVSELNEAAEGVIEAMARAVRESSGK
jgi:hypothetical protein